MKRRNNNYKKNNINIKVLLKKIIFKILYFLITICILYNVVFLLNTTISKKEYLSLFGITLLPVESNSMKNEINKNDLVIINRNKLIESELKEKDTIVYERNNQVRITKIHIIKTTNGNIQYITKAINNYYFDNEPVTFEQIMGKVQIVIPSFGLVLKVLQSKIITLISIILLVLKFSYNRYTYKMKLKRRIKKQKKTLNY